MGQKLRIHSLPYTRIERAYITSNDYVVVDWLSHQLLARFPTAAAHFPLFVANTSAAVQQSVITVMWDLASGANFVARSI